MAKKKFNTSLIDEAADIATVVDTPVEPPAPAPDPISTSRRRNRPQGTTPEKRKRDQGTEQLNIRVSSGAGKDIKRWALDHDVSPADVIEQGFELMKAKFGP